MTTRNDSDRRSSAAKLGWLRRRETARRKARHQAELVIAERMVAEARAEGLDAHLLGSRCVVLDSRVPPGMHLTFDMDRFRQMGQE